MNTYVSITRAYADQRTSSAYATKWDMLEKIGTTYVVLSNIGIVYSNIPWNIVFLSINIFLNCEIR